MSDTHTIDAIVQTDLEWSGSINRSTAQGEKFALLVAMLSEDIISRPSIAKTGDDASYTLGVQNYYRRSPLSAQKTDWKVLDQANFAFHQSVDDGRLWCALNPQPLSMFDDPLRLDEHIIANCGHNTQQRLNHSQRAEIQVDETGLYDVLEAIHA